MTTPPSRPQTVGVVGYQGQAYLIGVDGTRQIINAENGELGEDGKLSGVIFSGAPFALADGAWLFPTPQGLAKISPDLRSLLWQVADSPPFIRAHSVPDGRIALLSADHQFSLLNSDGSLISRAQLRDHASLGSSAAGDLLLYGLGGLWTIASDSSWIASDFPPAQSGASAMLWDQSAFYLFDGTVLRAYGLDNSLLWESPLPSTLSGLTQMIPFAEGLLIFGEDGTLVPLRTDGSLCPPLRVYGQAGRLWANYTDTALRLALAEQILALQTDGLC